MNSQVSDAERVQTLLAEVFQVPQEDITPDLAFGDLPQWDSLGHMEMMIRLEEQFGVEVGADTIAELVSIPAILTYIEKNSHSQAA